jgi:hypothetical protein
MKTDRRLFHEAMKELVHVANGKASRPVLNHVLLVVFDDKLIVRAASGTTTVDAEMPAEGPLSCCLPAKMLAALTKPEGKGDAGNVEIALDGDVASVVVEGLASRLATMPVTEFPAVPGDAAMDWSLVAMWPAAALREALARRSLPPTGTASTSPPCHQLCPRRCSWTWVQRRSCAACSAPVLESTHSSEDLVTGFQASYLRDAVGTKRAVVELGLDCPADALRLDADGQLAVVMPMRL